MSAERWDTLMLGTSIVLMGLIAGLFYAYACSVMPGLARASTRTYVETMREINLAILNPVFFAGFIGAGLVTAAALVLDWRSDSHPALWWIAAGLALWAVMFIVTMALNVPLNDELERVYKDGLEGDFARMREKFESSWVAWNIVRAAVATGALACLVRALVLEARA
jgi:uncharacterized membrane protein